MSKDENVRFSKKLETWDDVGKLHFIISNRGFQQGSTISLIKNKQNKVLIIKSYEICYPLVKKNIYIYININNNK